MLALGSPLLQEKFERAYAEQTALYDARVGDALQHAAAGGGAWQLVDALPLAAATASVSTGNARS